MQWDLLQPKTLVLLVALAAPSFANANESGPSVPPPQTPTPQSSAYPNTALGEEFGDMPWIIRNGAPFFSVYHVKDRNEGNTMWPEQIAIYAKNDTGTWFVYDSASWSICSFPVSNDYWPVRSLDIDLTSPAFDGYAVGSRIDFRWYIRFRDGLCINPVEKNQYFQVIKGESLPLFPGQFSANLHNHGFYTDNVGEWGGDRDLMVMAAKAIGLSIVLWTDHGYDFTDADCMAMKSYAQANTSGSFLLIPGVEGNIDNDDDNDNPDGFYHTLTNVCLRTPVEIIPGTDNTNSTLWPLDQFADAVDTNRGFWAAAHPFAARFIPGMDASSYTWSDPKIEEALSRGRFIGFQGWNRHRTSPQVTFQENNINPYPWTTDPNALNDLLVSLARRDEVQQAHLNPLRRANFLAGTDNHGGYAYTLERTSSSIDMVINNNALGRCMTVIEMPVLTEQEFWNALLVGRCYTTSGPACQFGVDYTNDGTPETTFGESHATSGGGVIRLKGASNAEFGQFTQARFIVVTATSKDTVTTAVSGMMPIALLAVSALPNEPSFVRAELITAGGYGDDLGRVYTGDLYFNVNDPVGVPETEHNVSPQLLLAANPAGEKAVLSWTADPPQWIGMFTIAGQRIAEWKHLSGLSLTISTADLPGGLYFLKAQFLSGSATTKLAVLR